MHTAAPQLLELFGYWQFAVCLFAGLGLLGIWWHIGRRQDDFGQVWLALSVFCWSVSGLLEAYYGYQSSSADLGTQGDMAIGLSAGRSILSLFNSLFILLALPWFRNLPTWLQPLVKNRFWPLIIGLPFLFSLLPTVSGLFSGRTSGFIGELDVYYALLTLAFLTVVLWTSFNKRRLPILAWLSVICTLVTILAQAYKFTDDVTSLLLFSAIFKTNLIMLFFALALSWVKELSEAAVLPGEQKLSLALLKGVDATTHKNYRRIRLSGLTSFKAPVEANLSPAAYELLHTFVERRLREDPAGGWLEIKPKQGSRGERQYDINDHNQIKRLVTNIADGIYGKGHWTKELHFDPLRSALFESSASQDRRIRLAIPGERVSLK
ncbi:hypothetical protein CEQ90_15955 [Lewinellaceae bacterium SD302]|nr:hypothetical protein CEQ90_15955 [Lewinellaceae bacterium SD302]